MREHDGPGTHRQFENMAVAHVLGGLDSDQGRVFRSHLLECPLCRARVGELRAIASDLAGVERDERRERSAKAVETKRRLDAESDAEEQPARRRTPSPWLLLVLVVALVGLGTYTLVLRGNYQRQQVLVQERLLESAALEHGEPLETRYLAPDVEGTAKAHQAGVVMLLEGLDDATSYGFYLVDDDRGVTVGSGPLQAAEGRVLQLLQDVPVTADRLLVTAPEGTWATEPDGERILEALVPDPAQQPASIGSG